MVGGDVLRAGQPQLAELYPGLADLLASVEARLRQVCEETDGFLSRAAQSALSGRGKRLRPAILLLAAESAGRATESSAILASVVELVHTASLVHDDVVDGSGSRRGKRSANAQWGSKISVLLGDYLLAGALDLLSTAERDKFLPQLLSVAKRMCAGQVEELLAAGRGVSEREYLAMVRAKTGALFGFCGGAGAESGGGSPEVAGALARFGERFGVAFQLADDILDLVGTDGRSGKPEGRDLAQRKFTLPLIIAAQRGGAKLREQLEGMLAQDGVSSQDARTVRELAESAGAIEFAWERVHEWLEAARDELAVVPEGDAKQALLVLAGERFPMPVMN